MKNAKQPPPKKMSRQEQINQALANHLAIVGPSAKSEFFNPDDFDCEVVGFIEEFDDVETGKSIGSRRIVKPDRPLGSPGRKTYTLTEPLHLVKGFNQIPVTVKPSRTVSATIIAICGKMKHNLK